MARLNFLLVGKTVALEISEARASKIYRRRTIRIPDHRSDIFLYCYVWCG